MKRKIQTLNTWQKLQENRLEKIESELNRSIQNVTESKALLEQLEDFAGQYGLKPGRCNILTISNTQLFTDKLHKTIEIQRQEVNKYKAEQLRVQQKYKEQYVSHQVAEKLHNKTKEKWQLVQAKREQKQLDEMSHSAIAAKKR
ncbi:flagellar export protein FliJ [Vibrio marisflavi]|uniref:Flagellar FliJ protein n=1 Tax=Vibrio marisflavi CECT 7928 TaxID=634439 RepID=A0ABM9A533_9VIBR|nr:flagellar export protein FliJ [Vibrio marisflavi]CAH0540075.1 hypothetical protein VMF7928_02603 [Vibrio marisflavi CECT 7928]